MSGKPPNTIDSLKKRVSIQPNGCWEWTGRRNSKGYGETSWEGKQKRVHRVFFEHFNGRLPEGMHVCHRCDNPPCCNPAHLFSGTAVENERDKVKKGRHRNMWTGPMTPEEKQRFVPRSVPKPRNQAPTSVVSA